MTTSISNHDWLCVQIVEHTALAVVFGDAQGNIRLWNKGAEQMFGWTAEEVLGRSMDMMIPEKHRTKHWEGYDRVMKTGVTSYGNKLLAVPALTKDGRRISIEFNIALLRSPSGEILGAAATIQEVTARWERDKELRARLAVAEAKAKEVASSQ